MQKTSTQAFILHTRPFKETSLLVEAFTHAEGRVSLVAKGARSASKKNQKRALLQPFTPLEISWSGKSNLKNLNQIEAKGLPFKLHSTPSICGLYLNELLLKLLTQWDPHPEIFKSYQKALEWLAANQTPQIILREFELYLLDELGYSIDWNCDIDGDLIDINQDYAFIPQQGFVLQQFKQGVLVISGKLIHSVAQYDWQTKGAVGLARKVSKSLIDHLLDGKELNSRKLLQQTLALKA
ncbi:DNA repair protein RecO [Kangiella sp. HZ709]|uniref:DNA repair protein RecO n=1 Tax=Kangiella sp. HZ709 TaxID=2666328 RepID=UPI0012B036E6|nr:DNA repair protein RecO [Kangiella sp. HZ709]MRX27344.1 DNA repair protein RecO [Kangiella sp. HZ709]